jgi:hypothetical protein
LAHKDHKRWQLHIVCYKGHRYLMWLTMNRSKSIPTSTSNHLFWMKHHQVYAIKFMLISTSKMVGLIILFWMLCLQKRLHNIKTVLDWSNWLYLSNFTTFTILVFMFMGKPFWTWKYCWKPKYWVWLELIQEHLQP